MPELQSIGNATTVPEASSGLVRKARNSHLPRWLTFRHETDLVKAECRWTGVWRGITLQGMSLRTRRPDGRRKLSSDRSVTNLAPTKAAKTTL
jgi:hypothetical protein